VFLLHQHQHLEASAIKEMTNLNVTELNKDENSSKELKPQEK
jgi:hypothetical protein